MPPRLPVRLMRTVVCPVPKRIPPRQQNLRRHLNLPSRLHDIDPNPKSIPSQSQVSVHKMHATAQLNSSNTPIAETNTFQFVEGNVYFPPASIPNFESVLTPSSRTTQCPWKGTAQYYDLHVDGKVVNNAAWGYPEPKGAANHIKGFVAFGQQLALKSQLWTYC